MKKNLLLAGFCLIISSVTAFADSYSIAKIDIGFGALDIPSGGGDLFLDFDAEKKITGLTIDVTTGFWDAEERTVEKISLDQLLSGETIHYQADGSSNPIFKITASPDFGPSGGGVRIGIRKEDGFHYEDVQLTRDPVSGLGFLWQQKSRIREIAINVRGMNPEKMCVGWYELN